MKDRTLLVVAVILALVFSAAWLWRAAGDDATPRMSVPAGQTGRLGTATYRLTSLQALPRASARYDGPVVATDGAALVLARIDYDAGGDTTSFSCMFELVAGEATWRADYTYSPPEPESASCDPDAAGTVTVLFEIPDRFVDQVQGVAVVNPGQTAPLLTGKPA